MSILPSFMLERIEETKADLAVMEIPREYGIDFETGLLTGETVEGLEAVKVWIWCCLKTERFRYPIYSWNYGASMEQYIGESLTEEYIEADCETEIEEALLVSPYITGISDFEIIFDADRLNIRFKAETRFGNMEVNESV